MVQRAEQAFQQQVASYLDHVVPGLLWWHVPNGAGNRGVRLGGILKSMGVKAGVPDIAMVLPMGRAAFIELKTPKGSLSADQKAFRDRAVAINAFWAEARSLADVEAILERWLTPFGWTLKARISA